MPFSLEDYKIGQRYSVARTSNENTTGGQGVELLESQPYTDEAGNNGFYTRKIYHLASYIPGWMRSIVPSSALKLEEKAWDVYPYCKTVLTSPFMGAKFEFVIESRHFSMDAGEQKNVHDLSPKLLKKRQVEIIDIATTKLDKKSYKIEEDPQFFTSKKTGMGPLKEGWQKSAKTYMCCYKLVRIKCKVLGLQKKIENFIMGMERDIFGRFHKQIFCWMDDWFGLSLEDIVREEKRFFDEMNQKVKQQTYEVAQPDDKEKEKWLESKEEPLSKHLTKEAAEALGVKDGEEEEKEEKDGKTEKVLSEN